MKKRFVRGGDVERSKSMKSTGMKTDLVDQQTKSVDRLNRNISQLTNSRVSSPNRQVVICNCL